MENSDKYLTKLSLEIGDTTVSWEVPFNDCTASDLLEAFYGLMVAQTWIPSSVLTCMRDFVEERLDDNE